MDVESGELFNKESALIDFAIALLNTWLEVCLNLFIGFGLLLILSLIEGMLVQLEARVRLVKTRTTVTVGHIVVYFLELFQDLVLLLGFAQFIAALMV